jgi:ParB family transcriptional regulator, chromosome partitioning protein
MPATAADAQLEQIRVAKIRPNPDNPRLAFRQSELDELQESIRLYGVQVPISVFRDGAHYILIDGERRWRCASKLNHKTIPALIQPRPSALENLLLMFNIHSLREQWDLLTIALKLPKVIDLIREAKGKEPTETDIANATGLLRSRIRRCKLLIELPEKYKLQLLEELKKPKGKQTLSEDFFIEMERALKTVGRAMPTAVPNKNKARDVLIAKYQGGVIKNLVDLRKIPRIARAEKIGADKQSAEQAIKKLVSDATYSIESAFESSVGDVYAERDIVSRIDSLITRIDQAEDDLLIDEDVRDKLEELQQRIQTVLEGDK